MKNLQYIKKQDIMNTLNNKIIERFPGKVVRKDLTKFLKGNAVVPSYVLEYLLGQHCSSNDEEIIKEGIIKVKNIIEENFVHRDQAEIVKSKIRERGAYRIIDKLSVKLLMIGLTDMKLILPI